MQNRTNGCLGATKSGKHYWPQIKSPTRLKGESPSSLLDNSNKGLKGRWRAAETKCVFGRLLINCLYNERFVWVLF